MATRGPAEGAAKAISRTREIEANDILDLCNILYGYAPDFRPLPYDSPIHK